MEDVSINYKALQESYKSLQIQLERKDKQISLFRDENKKLLQVIEAYETNSSKSSNNDSLSSDSKNVYERNLEIINEATTDDEYKFMEDLSREKNNGIDYGVEARSNIMKKFHTDAEQEFFILSVLSSKIDLASKGCSNSAVSDMDAQRLWNRAQETGIAMHQFHDWINNELLKVYQNTQKTANQISHRWSSYQSVHVGDQLRRDDLNKYQQTNPDLNIVDPEAGIPINITPSITTQRNENISPISPNACKQMLEEQQILTDEEEDDYDYEPDYNTTMQQRQLDLTDTTDLL